MGFDNLYICEICTSKEWFEQAQKSLELGPAEHRNLFWSQISHELSFTWQGSVYVLVGLWLSLTAQLAELDNNKTID